MDPIDLHATHMTRPDIIVALILTKITHPRINPTTIPVKVAADLLKNDSLAVFDPPRPLAE